VYAFDAVSGAQLWSAALSGAGQIGPVVVNGRLYVGDVGGTIRAWTP
jgi:outer membrane protein assembly factor BamB